MPPTIVPLTLSTHTYMPLTPTASLEASLQGASEKAALTQQQLDTTSNELANLQEQAKQQGAVLEELHSCVRVHVCVRAVYFVVNMQQGAALEELHSCVRVHVCVCAVYFVVNMQQGAALEELHRCVFVNT